MNTTIILPFADAESRTAIWADEEEKIDFRCEHDRAARCTTAFGAMELKRYLVRTVVFAISVSFCSRRPSKGFFIELRIRDHASKDERFSLIPCRRGIVISGYGRTGLLYGVYEFLRLQGWRWFAPDRTGEISPTPRKSLVLPKTRMEYKSSMRLGRGFDFEGASKESAELLLWMARNRLNIAGFRPATGALGEKLGMSLVSGGHVFESILNPDRVMASGKTLWEEHEDWFGLPADSNRKKETAIRTQFCVSQSDLIKFLGEELLDRVMGVWKAAERIYISGFDTWRGTCTCACCRKLGTGTDQMLFFVSSLRAFFDRARNRGRLDHNVRLVVCAYEGTCTILGPQKSFPKNMIDAGDYVVFYPINRCYAHDFCDDSCVDNISYKTAMRSWSARMPAIFPVMIGEYYNVSKFEDLPLLFTTRIANDLLGYYKLGARGMTYMHVPLVNWGMRTLTQLLYAQLTWDVDTDVSVFLKEYFDNWYGPHSRKMRQVYDLIEEAWHFIAQWRNWSIRSVLSQLLLWNGAKPQQPLSLNAHFITSAKAVKSGRRSIKLLKEALKIIDEAYVQNHRIAARKSAISNIKTVVNPAEADKIERKDQYGMRLGEDRRLLIYGIDTMKIMTELVAYHDALYNEDSFSADLAWKRIEDSAKSLDSYFIPICFKVAGVGLESKDALTRSQVRELVQRCRTYRIRYDDNALSAGIARRKE